MLTMLRISGLAVVDHAEVRFGPGLNVLTGETGAGKSILVGALHLVLGGRAGGEVVREGADEAVVEALFELPGDHPLFAKLEAAGIAAPPSGRSAELLVRRIVSRAGRGRAFVNGALCTVGMLADSMRGIVDVSGQHEHLTLLDERSHLGLLDACGEIDRTRYRELYDGLAEGLRERTKLEQGDAERAQRADYLAFQLRELEAVDPKAGEDEELARERTVLASAERLREAARLSEALVESEEGSASERLAQALKALADGAALDARLEEPVALLRSAVAEVQEAGRQLARYAELVGGDPDRLQLVEERLDALHRIARKNGGTIASAIARRDDMRAELAALGGSDERLAALGRELAERGPRVLAAARALSLARKAAARRFASAVEGELGRLAMARCRVHVELAPAADGLQWEGTALGPEGAETVRVLIAPNPGEPARPLAKTASGGELSRLLLAVKRAVASVDPVSTYVFDEVDSGIGGAVAEAVGRVLSEVAADGQVICVTHLPQVAAFADRHVRVAKRVAQGRTSTCVSELPAEDDRRAEVARMLAGAEVTASALDHAGALIAAARRGHPARTDGKHRDTTVAATRRERPPSQRESARRVAPSRNAARTASR
ncbi:MAG TPA: DNA repair protein RecN [Anaeromyxobacteraceae bacterium]|nr:DNA repair protein RecN [Anaeromyxobacteraceae bacterium]